MKNIFISIVILLLTNHSFGYYYCVCRSAPDSPDGQHCSKRYCIESPQIYLTPWRSCDILDGLICRCTGVSNTRTCDLCGCRPRTPVIIDRPIYINRTVYIEKPIYINQTLEIPVGRVIYVNNTDTNLTYETFNSQNEIIKIIMLSFIGLFVGSSIKLLHLQKIMFNKKN